MAFKKSSFHCRECGAMMQLYVPAGDGKSHYGGEVQENPPLWARWHTGMTCPKCDSAAVKPMEKVSESGSAARLSELQERRKLGEDEDDDLDSDRSGLVIAGVVALILVGLVCLCSIWRSTGGRKAELSRYERDLQSLQTQEQQLPSEIAITTEMAAEDPEVAKLLQESDQESDRPPKTQPAGRPGPEPGAEVPKVTDQPPHERPHETGAPLAEQFAPTTPEQKAAIEKYSRMVTKLGHTEVEFLTPAEGRDRLEKLRHRLGGGNRPPTEDQPPPTE